MNDTRYKILKQKKRWLSLFAELYSDKEYDKIICLYNELVSDNILRHTVEDIDSVDDNKEFRILMYIELAFVNKHSDIETWNNL
ncbi:hypothetical protein DW985_24905 [Bacteroides ovatus]|jgi:hypothetical protein|nr:hypothetical protein DW985_24905 [Bacteroides ovatus]